MDKLKNQNGYTLIETLVSIIILGLAIGFFAVFFKQIYANSKILLKSDAIVLANHEIERCINFKIVSDTNYFNSLGNLMVSRKIESLGKLNNALVSIASDSGKKEIITLSAVYIK